MRKFLKACKGKYGYIKEPANSAFNLVEKLAKDWREINEGVNMLTVPIYEVCRKKKCKIFGKCADYHWVAETGDRRVCKPRPNEQHYNYSERFGDASTANDAAPRCKTEHEEEFNEENSR